MSVQDGELLRLFRLFLLRYFNNQVADVCNGDGEQEIMDSQIYRFSHNFSYFLCDNWSSQADPLFCAYGYLLESLRSLSISFLRKTPYQVDGKWHLMSYQCFVTHPSL